MPKSGQSAGWCKKHYLSGLGLIVMFAAGLAFALYQQSQRIAPLSLNTLSGKSITVPSEGLTWVNFWSVTCPPCMEEMPYLDSLHEEYQGRARIVGISAYYDPPDAIIAMRDRLKLHNMPLALDINGIAAQQFPDNEVVPTHYLLDAKGNILLSAQGTLSEARIREALEQHL